MADFYQRLNEDLSEVKKYIKGTHICWLYINSDNSKTYVMVVPSFEYICFNEGFMTKDFEYKERTICIRGLRHTYNAAYSGHPEYLESLYTDKILINPRYEEIYYNLFKDRRDEIADGAAAGDPSLALEIAIKALMRAVLLDNSTPMGFIKSLSDVEKGCIEEIVSTIGLEGTFSQAKLAAKIGVPRIIMTNAVQKMKDWGMAEIQYNGVKGTHCKILETAILDIKGKNFMSPNKGF